MVDSSIFLSGLLVILLNLICSIQRTGKTLAKSEFDLKFKLTLFSICYISVSISCDLNPSNTEGRLRKQLLCKYDKDLIPTVDKKHPVLISLTLAVKSFNFVRIKMYIVETVFFLRFPLNHSTTMKMFWKFRRGCLW